MQLVYHLNIISLCIRFLPQYRSKVTHLFTKYTMKIVCYSTRNPIWYMRKLNPEEVKSF